MKKLLSYSICLIILISAFIPKAVISAENYSGNVYYFDSVNGDDENDGLSINSPKKTPRKIMTRLSSGDAVLLKRGCIFPTSTISVKKSGTEDEPITLSCYGDETEDLPIIMGKDTTDDVIRIDNQSYITIDSLHIISSYSEIETPASCIKIQAKDGKTILNNTVKNCILEGDNDDWNNHYQSGLDGISVDPISYYGYFNGITIENNEIYNVKSVGIDINGCYGGSNSLGVVNEPSAKNVVIRNNFLYNIGKDGIRVTNCNSPLVEYNTCGKSHSFAKTTWHVAIWPFACYNSLFQYNEAYDTKTTYDGQGFDCDYQSYGTLFQYNYSHDNEGGFMLICTEPTFLNNTAFNVGATVRYNISQNDMNTLINLTGHITDTKIYNNTIYTNKYVRLVLNVYSRDRMTYPINTKIYNNIFYTKYGDFNWEINTGTEYYTTGTEFKNNLVYGDNYLNYPQNDSASEKGDGITAENNIYNKDPLFLKPGGAMKGLESCYAYKLQASSPALKSGMIIEDNNKFDFFGNEVNNTDKPNIGAYNGKGIKLSIGDVNADENINLIDIICLKSYLLNYYGDNDINFKNTDLNNDGKIDLKDYVLLRKLISKNS